MSTTQPNYGLCDCGNRATRPAPGGGVECERCHAIEATAAKEYRRRPRKDDPRRHVAPIMRVEMNLACDEFMKRRGLAPDHSFAEQARQAATIALEKKRVFEGETA